MAQTQMSNEMSLVFVLPYEMLLRIFSYLQVRDIASCLSRVCALFHQFASDEYLWKPMCLSRWSYLKVTYEQLVNPTLSWKNFYKSMLDPNNLSVLVIGAEGGGEKDERLDDVRSKLVSRGIRRVDTFNARVKTPTHEQLRQYQAILFFSYHGFSQVAIGDLLANYVDEGGGVVVATYSNCGTGNRIEGRWMQEAYDPLLVGTTSRTNGLSMGKFIPSHPILAGVLSFEGGVLSSHGDGKLHPDAQVIAEWSNGRPLVSELKKSKTSIININFYPPSLDVAEGSWNPSTDGSLIIANSLYYTCRVQN